MILKILPLLFDIFLTELVKRLFEIFNYSMGNCTKIVASDETEVDRALSNR